MDTKTLIYDEIIRKIEAIGVENVAGLFYPKKMDSIYWRKKNKIPVNGDFDRLMKLWRELTIIRNCMLGAVRGVRTSELVAKKILEKLKKYPEIEKHLLERL